MKCSNCGNEMREDARFCPNCGTVAGGAAVPGGTAGPELTAPGGGKRRTSPFLFAGLALVIVAVVTVVSVVALGASPKNDLEQAIQKTAEAYAEIDGSMGLPDLGRMLLEQSISQSASLELTGINSLLLGSDIPDLSGLKLQLDSNLDGAGRRFDTRFLIGWGDDDIFSTHLLAADNLLYLSIPQLMGDNAYSVDTETLWEDSGVPDMQKGFNLFDVLELFLSDGEPDQTVERKIDAAAKELVAAIEVKKTGTQTLEVNGHQVNATAYHVIIPQKAVEGYFDALVDILNTAYDPEAYRALWEALGVSGDQIDELISTMSQNPYDELANALKLLTGLLGDLELDVYLNDGYISAVIWEREFLGEQLKMALYLGGGQRYVDDFSLEIDVSGNGLLLESSGDRGGQDGAFTDETSILLRSVGSTPVRLTSSFRYDPAASGDNLQWDLGVDNAGSLEMAGRLETTEDSMSLSLDDISLKIMGLEIATFRMDYSVGPYAEVEVPPEPAILLNDLSESELEQLLADMEQRAGSWLVELQQSFLMIPQAIA